MGKRGRPTKTPTDDDRTKVRKLLAEKSPIAEVAAMFGYSIPTFRKYFQAEFFSEKKSTEANKPVRNVTEAMRDKVKRYVGTGIGPEQVALLFGYQTEDDFKEFEATFELELKIADVVVRAEIVDRLHEQSKGGMVGATNKLEALTQTAQAAQAPKGSQSGYISKKAAAQEKAEEISTRLRMIGPPTLKAVK